MSLTTHINRTYRIFIPTTREGLLFFLAMSSSSKLLLVKLKVEYNIIFKLLDENNKLFSKIR